MKRDILSIYLPAIFACFLWGTATPIVKFGLEYDPPLLFASKRFIIAGISLMILSGSLKHYFESVFKSYKKILFLGIVSTFMSSFLFYSAVNIIPASIAAIIVGAQPIIIAIISHFFGINDKLNFVKIFSFFLGFIGIVIISFPDSSTIEEYNIWGLIMLVFVNILQGIANVYLARDKSDIAPRVLTSSQIILGGILLFLTSIFTEKTYSIEKTYSYYGALAWLSTVSATSIGIWFFLIKEKRVAVSKINIWKFLMPIFGVLISWILLDEYITKKILFGMMIVVFSIIILGVSHMKKY